MDPTAPRTGTDYYGSENDAPTGKYDTTWLKWGSKLSDENKTWKIDSHNQYWYNWDNELVSKTTYTNVSK